MGRKPSESLPWYLNVCRQRKRDNGEERSALSPTGNDRWHEVLKFAHLYHGNHHEFEADSNVTDFLSGLRVATQLVNEKKYAEAITAYVALAEGSQGKATALQQSFALKQAAAIARRMKDAEQADALATRIPVDAERKNAEMQNLMARRKFADLIERFGNEDLTQRPFWAAGEGYYIRGRAYAALGEKAKAEADLKAALELTGDERVRNNVSEAFEKLVK